MSHEHLIDQGIIDAAKARLDAVVARRGPAQTTLDAARKSHSAAIETSRRALSGSSARCPHEAQAELDGAAKRLDVAERAVPAIDGAVVEAERYVREQTGLAWRPVAIEAERQRLQACRDADTARALLTAAAVAFKSATTLAVVAITHGAGSVVHDSKLDAISPSLSRPDHPVIPPTRAEELTLLSDRLGWWPEMAGEFQT